MMGAQKRNLDTMQGAALYGQVGMAPQQQHQQQFPQQQQQQQGLAYMQQAAQPPPPKSHLGQTSLSVIQSQQQRQQQEAQPGGDVASIYQVPQMGAAQAMPQAQFPQQLQHAFQPQHVGGAMGMYGSSGMGGALQQQQQQPQQQQQVFGGQPLQQQQYGAPADGTGGYTYQPDGGYGMQPGADTHGLSCTRHNSQRACGLSLPSRLVRHAPLRMLGRQNRFACVRVVSARARTGGQRTARICGLNRAGPYSSPAKQGRF